MKVTGLGGSSLYQVHLHIALHDSVTEYEEAYDRLKTEPAVTEKTATPRLIALHYALEQKRIRVILFAASCVEAVANLYLALKATPDQFAILEKATFIDKWTVAFSLLLPGYSLAKDGQLYQDMRRLQVRRNALAHPKEEISTGLGIVHPGSIPVVAGDEYFFISRCRSLPEALVCHLAEFDQTDTIARIKMITAMVPIFLEMRRFI